MRELNDNQLEFVLTFFKDEKHPGWKNIATKLIKNGNCIVAGDKCIWLGGVGNFIHTSKTDDFFGCLKYEFDLEDFLTSSFFKETYAFKLSDVIDERQKQNDLLNDLIKLKKD